MSVLWLFLALWLAHVDSYLSSAPLSSTTWALSPLSYRSTARVIASPASPARMARWRCAATGAAETTVQSIMTGRDKLMTLTPDMPINTAVRILLDNSLNGAPVVSRLQPNTLLGVMSSFDILWKEAGTKEVSKYFESDNYEDIVRKILAGKVRDAMSKQPLSVPPSCRLGPRAHVA